MKEIKVDAGEILRKVPIFSGLSDVEWRELSQRVVPRRYEAGQTIFAEGDACDEEQQCRNKRAHEILRA